MKLVISIVSNKDTQALLERLVEKGYRATKLASSGGFLKKGNTTLLIGVEDELVDSVIEEIKSVCKVRQEVVTPIAPMPGTAEVFFPYSVEVPVGGATLFVLDVERYCKV